MDRGRGGGGGVAGSDAVVLRRGYFPGRVIALEHFLSIDDPATKVSRPIPHTVHWQSWVPACFNPQLAWFGFLSATGQTPGNSSLKLFERMIVSRDKPRRIEALIRTWIVAVAAIVAWVLPIPWYFSAALFLGVLVVLGIFYPALRIRPRK
jgi:hypothetical protein